MGAEGEIERVRWTVNDYHRMGDVGLLAENERTELIDGEIVRMPPIGLPHAAIVNRLNKLLTMLMGEQGLVSCANPVVLYPDSEPQPDLMVLAPHADDYYTRPPQSNDVLLLIEVSDSTLRFDLGVKAPLYARHGVAEVWVVDVAHRRVIAFDRPDESGYRRRVEFGVADTLSPKRLPGLLVPLAGILRQS
ncbi:MAG: Uma2 family endonuclease [Proteobacteria bacterium]|nr:Uma2 family endonuclease [Burkholderiales bacterium]